MLWLAYNLQCDQFWNSFHIYSDEEKVRSVSIGWKVPEMAVKPIYSIAWGALLLDEFLSHLSNELSEVLRSLTSIISQSISPFKSTHICFMYLDVLTFGAYIFIIMVPFCWMDPYPYVVPFFISFNAVHAKVSTHDCSSLRLSRNIGRLHSAEKILN